MIIAMDTLQPRRRRIALVVRLRRCYWKRLRRYRYEMCGSVVPGMEAEGTIRRYGCGRPVWFVWRADTRFWHRMVTGQPLPSGRSEGASGILCIPCFDQLCRDRGETRMWFAGDL